MDAYAQYARFRRSRPMGLSNRRLASLLGDFAYETSSAEDESRRYLEMLYDEGKRVLAGPDLKSLEAFTSEHNRDQRRAEGIKEKHVSWGLVDGLSQRIIHTLSQTAGRTEPDFAENSAALDRMFLTTKALRDFRNQVAHRTPSDGGGQLRFYRKNDSSVTPRDIWGWTEVAASYWSNLTPITNAMTKATGGVSVAWTVTRDSRTLQWPPASISIHGLRVIQRSGIPVSDQRLRDAQAEWVGLTRGGRVNLTDPHLAISRLCPLHLRQSGTGFRPLAECWISGHFAALPAPRASEPSPMLSP